MSPDRLHGALRQLFEAARKCGRAGGPQPLERFVRHRDEAAVRALLARHGATVLGVCRRALRGPAAAADAFQATFLVLARRAAALRSGESLADWLYGVARRTAARAKVEAARRQAREAAVPAPTRLRTRSARSRPGSSSRSGTRRCRGCRPGTAARSCCATSRG